MTVVDPRKPVSGLQRPDMRSARRIDGSAGQAASKARTGLATLIIVAGLIVTYVVLPSSDSVEIFRIGAIGVGVSLGLGTLAEIPSGVRALIRVDLLMLWILYGLTFFEFLFPQPDVDAVVLSGAAVDGTMVTLLGFAGLAIGRHLVPQQRARTGPIIDPKSHEIFILFVAAASLGYLHILYAVNFDVIEALQEMSWPRFSQAWSRGRYGGDIFSLLVEVGALIYLIPPISGVVFARSRKYTFVQKFVVTIVLLITIYYGISTGTRNVIAVYIFTFFGAYYLNKERIRWWPFILHGVTAVGLLVLITTYMLAFRSVGLGNFSLSEKTPSTVFIDHNMAVIATMTTVFPEQYNYLGMEVVYLSLVHPIPRALWPGKPDGLSVSIESVVGTDQATISSTFIGEAYMSGGLIGVILLSLCFGAAGELWNRVGRGTPSAYSQLLYASGFFCVAITMRSMLWMTVTMLPSVALWCYGKLWLSRTPAPRGDVR